MRRQGSEAAYDAWEALLKKLKNELDIGANGKIPRKLGQTPFNTPEAILKRHTYAFVRGMLRLDGGRSLESVLDDLRGDMQPKRPAAKGKRGSKKRLRERRVKFQDNPFHCTLQMVSLKVMPTVPSKHLSQKTELFGRSVCTRFGRQLNYAHMHDIDPNLLIGFLHQSGNVSKICESAADPTKREAWYLNELNEAQSDSTSDEGYPLAVIDFDATAKTLDSYPVRIGLAIADRPDSKIRLKGTLIQPPRKRQIDEQWYREAGKRLGISQQDLRDAREPIEVVEGLAEYIAVGGIVYCDNISMASYWLDMVFEQAGEEQEFELRDVGDYLGHVASKRTELRNLLQQSAEPKVASKRAKRLCSALIEINSR